MVNFGSYLLSKLFVLLDALGGVYVEFLVLVWRSCHRVVKDLSAIVYLVSLTSSCVDGDVKLMCFCWRV